MVLSFFKVSINLKPVRTSLILRQYILKPKMNSLGCSVSREERLENLDYAVYIKDLCVSYNEEVEIVKNLSMKVKRRTM